MKKVTIFLIIGMTLAVLSAIALPGHQGGTPTSNRASNSIWNAIKAGTAMELTALANSSELLPGEAVSKVPTEPNQR